MGTGLDIELDAKEEIELVEPEMCSVYLLNDDYTTFEFVIKILTQVFRKTREEAEKITMDIHVQKEGCAGIYTRDIALTKIDQVARMSEKSQYPLKAIIK